MINIVEEDNIFTVRYARAFKTKNGKEMVSDAVFYIALGFRYSIYKHIVQTFNGNVLGPHRSTKFRKKADAERFVEEWLNPRMVSLILEDKLKFFDFKVD